MGLDWDGPEVFQFIRAARHREVAEAMLQQGRAYRCYATAEELTAMREEQKAAGKPMRYDGRWRDRDAKDAPAGAPFVVRLKAETSGETVVNDVVLGDVRFANDQLDDMVLLRSDGSPTYMLAVVVDDHDMGITHVIRGADHLNNTPRQLQIISAMGWENRPAAICRSSTAPTAPSCPSAMARWQWKRTATWSCLPETMRNYLLRLRLEPWRRRDHSHQASHQNGSIFDSIGKKRGADMDLQEAGQSERPLYPRNPGRCAGGGMHRLSWNAQIPAACILSAQARTEAAGRPCRD